MKMLLSKELLPAKTNLKGGNIIFLRDGHTLLFVLKNM